MSTIAYITDIHLDEGLLEQHGVDSRRNWEQILADVSARGITDIIFGGDIGSAGAYPWFFASLQKFRYRFILGNHDTFIGASGFLNMPNAGTNEFYFAEERGDLKYIFMDTAAEHISQQQFDWLRIQLDTDKPVVIIIHHPVFAVSAGIDHIYPLGGRGQISEALQNSGKQITLFCGHYHLSDVQVIGNITQYVTPAASYQIIKHVDDIQTSNSTFGYRLLHINNTDIHTQLLLHRSGKFEPANDEL